jgi:hypothetical protein
VRAQDNLDVKAQDDSSRFDWLAYLPFVENRPTKETTQKSVDLYFSPKAPCGQEGRWIQTIPDEAT